MWHIYVILTLYFTDAATNNNFTCICPEGFVGSDCGIAFCEQTPCLNGGFCDSSSMVSSYYCYFILRIGTSPSSIFYSFIIMLIVTIIIYIL